MAALRELRDSLRGLWQLEKHPPKGLPEQLLEMIRATANENARILRILEVMSTEELNDPTSISAARRKEIAQQSRRPLTEVCRLLTMELEPPDPPLRRA